MKALALALAIAAVAAHASAQDVPDAYVVPPAHLRFETPEGSERASGSSALVLSRLDTGGGWTLLAVAPCDFAAPRGPTQLALSLGNHAPVPVPMVIDLEDGATLVGQYESRQWLRELGVGTLLGTAALVLIGIAIGVSGFLANDVNVGIGGLAAAGCVGVVGGATGIALATLDDLATIDLR